jgi:hypothetical protein
MQEQEIISPQSPNSSNSDDNIQSENDSNEDKNNNFSLDKLPLSSHDKDSDNDIIEDMHKKLEKQITKMNVPPPLPPTNRQISRPV